MIVVQSAGECCCGPNRLEQQIIQVEAFGKNKERHNKLVHL